MKKKYLSLALALTMVLSILSGCGKTAATSEVLTEASTEVVATVDDASASTATDASATDANGLPTKDRAGNDILVPTEIKSIVSMAPSTTRVLIDLGLADKIVAIDTNSAVYADQLSADVTQFDMMEPDVEAIVDLEPSIVFTSGMSSYGGDDAFQSVRDANICVADIPSSTSFEAISEDLAFIGACVGKAAEADKLIADFEGQIKDVQDTAKDAANEETSVLFLLSVPTADYPTVYSVGKGTYIDEMITATGAKNACGDQDSWVSLSEEEAVALDPDVIIIAGSAYYTEDPVTTIKNASAWSATKAVKNNQVFVVDGDSVNQPNNHVADALVQMAKFIFPSTFADFKDPFATATDAE